MFVVSRRNIILPGPSGERFKMQKGYMGPVPAWAKNSAYLKALEADGKVILSVSGTDKDFGKKKKSPKEKPPKEEEEKEKPPKEETEKEPEEEETAQDGQEDPDALGK